MSGDLQDRIAILSMACRAPGAAGVDELWRNLEAGVESISSFSDAELREAGVPARLLADPAYVKAWGVMRGGDLFDAALFGFTPREAERTDPQHRVLLECAWEALEAAGYGQEAQAGPAGVFVGADATDHLSALAAGSGAGMEELIGAGTGFLATRLSYKLNLSGPSLTVQTACSTSLVALHLACKSLLDGECDLALAGGVALRLPEERGYRYQEGGIYSPDGHCRAFDAAAAGTVGGHGAGVVLLKRLEDALDDGDPVRAVVLASAMNNDGAAKVGFTAPSVEGQARVIAEALALARIEPGSVGYVETHGTGTPLGDPIEIAALTQAFRAAAGRGGGGSCALGSIKTNLGHLGSAAGVLGLIKAVLALEREAIPPSLHFQAPNPRIDLAGGPFYVASRLVPWPRGPRPRRAGVSSFGIGGTNVHVVLEEAPLPTPPPASRPWHLLPVSARTETALEAAAGRLAGHLAVHPELAPADVAFTLQAGRRAFEHRAFAVCAGLAEAPAALRSAPRRARLPGTPEVAFLFPGQGAQRPGAGREVYAREEVFRREVDRCCEILREPLGFDLREALFAPPEDPEAAERLRRTAVAQPALFVLEHALASLWISWGVVPAALLGHSVGEYTAACLAGVFDLETALGLVAARGAMMQELPAGAMLAVPLPERELAGLLAPGMALAAVNAPGRCVASGPEEAVAGLEERLRERGVPSRRLATSHAFHSSVVEPVLAPFEDQVRAAAPRPPRVPFLSNVTGDWITAAEATDPVYWARHLRATVRFADGARRLAEEPSRLFLEVGPGDTLTRLARQSLGPFAAGRDVAFATLPGAGGTPEAAALLDAAGRLWCAGARIDWTALHDGPRRRVPLPAYPFERRSHRLRRAPEPTPPAGAEAAVVESAGEPGIEELLAPGLALAAVNAPGRCVASGPEEAVAGLEERLRERGVPSRRLATSHAFHSAVVEPILAPFAERVRAAAPRPPRIPFLSNVTGDWITAAEATDPGYWARHLRATVRFADGARRLAEEPSRLFLEVGPGDTLTRLTRQSLGPFAAGRDVAFATLPGAGGTPEAAALLDAAGRLWCAGARIDWTALHDGPRRRVPLPVYPFERRPYRLRRDPEPAPPAAIEAAEGAGEPGIEELLARQLALISRQLDLLEGSG